MDYLHVTKWLDIAVDRLRDTLNPEQIILFGSWARGTATRRSDLDFFVLWDNNYPPLERIGKVLELLQDAPCPIEAIVYTPDELARRRDLPFIRRVLEEGKVLYERGKAEA